MERLAIAGAAPADAEERGAGGIENEVGIAAREFGEGFGYDGRIDVAYRAAATAAQVGVGARLGFVERGGSAG